MSPCWPLVPLREILKPLSRPESVEPSKTYRILGAHWYAKGLYIKDVTSGSGIRAAKVFRVEEEDFVYNRLFAWKGSFALATNENHGCYVSNEFPCFTVDHERADGKFLWNYFSRAGAWDEALGLSKGGTPTSRNRLKEEQFLALKIPLPSLSEQRRIVARIEDLATKINEARRLRREVESESLALCRSMIFSGSSDHSKQTPMREFVKLREPDVAVQPETTYRFAGVYCFGGGVFKGPTKTGAEFAYRRLTCLGVGDFVYPKLMAWEGALGTVPPECDGLFVSPEFPVFEVDQKRALPETLDVYFRTPSVWPLLSAVSTGTNVRRRRLNPADFLRFEMALPPMEVQQRLRAVKAKTEVAKKIRAGIDAELGAMLPSILDKAFKGEL